MDICLYVAEGEIEKRFLTELKQLGYIVPGRFCKFNLMQNRVKDSDSIMSRRYSRIICIIDTDCAENIQLDNLKFNLNKFSSICGRIEVLVQNKNFEDELSRLLSCKNMLTAFNKKFDGVKELKKYLAQKVVYEKVIDPSQLLLYGGNNRDFKDLWKFRFNDARITFITGYDIEIDLY